MTRLERIIRRRRQLHRPLFDVHYRRPLVGALGSKLVGTSPRMLNGRSSDWLPPVVSRRLGRLLLRLGDGLLVRSRPLYSFDRVTWYIAREWARRYETAGPEDAGSSDEADSRQTEFDEAGELLARAEALAAAIGLRINRLARHSPGDKVTWIATARGIEVASQHHGAGPTAAAALEELMARLHLEAEARAAGATRGEASSE